VANGEAESQDWNEHSALESLPASNTYRRKDAEACPHSEH